MPTQSRALPSRELLRRLIHSDRRRWPRRTRGWVSLPRLRLPTRNVVIKFSGLGGVQLRHRAFQLAAIDFNAANRSVEL